MCTLLLRPNGQPARYFVGLDLGQKQDYTALAVVERVERYTGEVDRVTYERKREVLYWLRHLERAPLGTPYPRVVERVKEVVQAPDLAGVSRLVVDATGVGAPVVDLLKAARLGCLTEVTITGGDREVEVEGGARVPKRDLVVGLQVMFEQGLLKIARGLEGKDLLVKEMMSMRVSVSDSGHESYAAGREGPHDDLVLAVGLACWKARKKRWEMFGTRNIGIYG